MTQFTQLNLSAKSSKPSSNTGHSIPRTKTAMVVGLLTIATISGAALLALNGCSKKEPAKSEAMSATQPTMPASPTLNPSSPVGETSAPKPVKKPRKSSSVTYVNRTYGLSLQYPRKYSLKTGDEAQLELNGSPLPMDFVKPGGITVAAIEMPHTMYPGTDLNQAFLMVNVNRNLTASECEFAAPQASGSEVTPVSEVKPGSDVQPVSNDKPISESKSPEKVKIGQTEFSQDKGSADVTKQSEAKYYHVFENRACYEFALALSTGLAGAENETKPVDRDAAFGKLEKILATVKIKGPAVPKEAAKQEIGASSKDSSLQPTNPEASSAQTTEPQKFEPTPVHPE